MAANTSGYCACSPSQALCTKPCIGVGSSAPPSQTNYFIFRSELHLPSGGSVALKWFKFPSTWPHNSFLFPTLVVTCGRFQSLDQWLLYRATQICDTQPHSFTEARPLGESELEGRGKLALVCHPILGSCLLGAVLFCNTCLLKTLHGVSFKYSNKAACCLFYLHYSILCLSVSVCVYTCEAHTSTHKHTATAALWLTGWSLHLREFSYLCPPSCCKGPGITNVHYCVQLSGVWRFELRTS